MGRSGSSPEPLSPRCRPAAASRGRCCRRPARGEGTGRGPGLRRGPPCSPRASEASGPAAGGSRGSPSALLPRSAKHGASPPASGRLPPSSGGLEPAGSPGGAVPCSPSARGAPCFASRGRGGGGPRGAAEGRGGRDPAPVSPGL